MMTGSFGLELRIKVPSALSKSHTFSDNRAASAMGWKPGAVFYSGRPFSVQSGA